MKVVTVYDKFLPLTNFKKKLKSLGSYDLNIIYLDWNSGIETGEFAQKLRNIEDEGPEAETPPLRLEKEIVEADILLVGFSPIPKRVIEEAKHLKVICCARTAYRNIDVKAALKKGILVLNAPGRTANAVADLTIGLLLAEARNIARGHTALKKGIWTKDFPNADFQVNLPGKSLGIIGFGKIGRKVHQRAQGFEMTTLIYDPFVPENEIRKLGGKPVSLKELLEESDFVTIHVPLNDETKKLIGDTELNLMKSTSYLINTSRGEIIDEKALIRALQEHKIMGAALDVFEKEPLERNHPLLQLKNVTLTPHLGGFTMDSRAEGVRIIIDDLKRYLNGLKPRNIIN